MPFNPFVLLESNLTIGGVDVTGQVREFRLHGTRDIIVIAPSLAEPRQHKAGASDWFLDVVYLTGTDATALTMALWAAITSPAATVPFSGRLHAGAVSGSNPEWSGELVVASWGVGGAVGTAATDSSTFPLAAPPAMTPT